ncbi:hypothetical protein POJ06DRAFT_244066 [Lipomyces tetrasporus]|uniref:IPT/TIG domain-containing protein n=1 Tax=Lipomyces tetrasporus TaxID=54092 RepID=A0AAD7VWJ9_9ASCO|nr:uncharacterized protein POJ06DRAFT_244066 [Lipomyces tetrasporus]KAJ8104261.1 hypothetical protein POJ06DRAFT_244066 [Lipomyces tetrasporus]
MDPLMDQVEASERAFASPVFYLDTDDADYFAFHDLDLDSSASQSVNGASSAEVVDPFDEMMVDGDAPVSMTEQHFLQPSLIVSERSTDTASPTSSNTTPVLTHDEDDIEDEDVDDRYMAEHFDFDSATTSHRRLRSHREGLTANRAANAASTGITIRSSDSDSSLSSVKRDTFSYPPSPKSLSSQHSTPFSVKSASSQVAAAAPSKLVHTTSHKQQQMRNGLPLSVRDITPPHHSPGHLPSPTCQTNGVIDEQVYTRPQDWVPPPMMPEFDPLDWIRDESPFQLSVSTDTLKSRVETQIKALLTFRPAPSQLYMHLPATTIAKPRQQLRKIFASDPKTLELDAIVVCDHNRYKYINVCPGCMNRERKRASRKKLPSVDDTHWLESQDNRGIMFNCAELMEISDPSTPSTVADTFSQDGNGDIKHVEIPMRIPCYCRHHSEKTGFRVYFVIKDHSGNVVARTFTEPIMITDDHKTTNANARRKTAAGATSTTQPASSANVSDNSSESPTNEYGFSEMANPRKRKMSPSLGRTQSESVLPTTAGPQQLQTLQQSQPQRGLSNGIPARPRQQSATSINTGSQPEPYYRAYDESNFNTRSHSVESFGFPAYSSSNPLQVHQQLQSQTQQLTGLSPLSHASPVLSNASTPESNVSSTLSRRASKFSTTSASAVPPVQSPRERTSNAGIECPALQRLIPTEGPIRGGIEVTLLGTSFHQGLTVMFGDQPAVKTHIWNESTIVAILPPAATPGPVVVRLRSISEISSDNLKLFTYIDDTDRQLMELALQVIGLKMTGRLEDARQIAMRIVSQTGSGGDNGSGGQSNIMAATTASGSNGLEKTLLKCLDLVDYNESPHKVQWQLHNSAGQTMLHLAAVLGFQRLVAALLARGASYRLKDHSGYTPLHFAAMRGHREIVLRLLNSGADPLARSVLGHTVIDLSCNDEISALLTSFITEPMDYGVNSRQYSESRISSRQNSYSRQNPEFPDWPSSSGPSSPAGSTSDELEYADSLGDDDTPLDIGRSNEDQDDAPLSMEGLRRARVGMNIPTADSKKTEKKSRPWSRKKLFGRSSQKSASDVLDTNGASKQKQLQLRLAEYLASLHEQTLNRMHPNWHAANHFMHDAFTSFSSFKPALANIANQQSRRANEIMQSAFENSWFGDYFSSTGASGGKNDNGAPPSYDEIYPDTNASSSFAHPSASSDAKDGAVRSATWQDEESKLREQEILLKFWQNKKKKQMRNDLMLFAFWLPVLCVILAWGAMSFFGIQVLDYIPIPQKLVEFIADRQKFAVASAGQVLQPGVDTLGTQHRIVPVA